MSPFKQIKQFSLLSFMIAVITGILYRYGMLYPIPDSLHLSDIRHAHSHLMLFNWVCPLIMLFMAEQLIALSDGEPTDHDRLVRQFRNCLYSILFLGLLSYPFFFFFGYRPVPIGTFNLPLAAIISGLIMLNWYWFSWIYYKNRKGKLSLSYSTDHSGVLLSYLTERSGVKHRSRHESEFKPTLSLTFFDASLVALLISSLGAWGVSIFQFTSADSALISSALTHFFLALFTEGWAILGILGILWSRADLHSIPIHSGWLWIPILFGSMLIFPFSLTQSLLSPVMVWTAKTGTFLIAGSLLLNLFYLNKAGLFKGFIWKSIGLFLCVKIIFQLIAITPVEFWPGDHGLRVLYLHLVLLGLVSTILFTSFKNHFTELPIILFVLSVWFIILSLMMISGYWPLQLQPANLYYWVLSAATLPLFPAFWIWVHHYKTEV